MGKSSLLRLCAGLLAQNEGANEGANEGTVEWYKNGQPIPAAQIISYQAHRDPLKPTLSAKENLDFWLKMRGFDGQGEADILAALSAVNMAAYADSRAGTLSAGQSRRVALAKLILDNKPIWLMDEPSAAMDAHGKAIITELIQSQLARGGAVMLASHSAPHALSNQARLLTLNNAVEPANLAGQLAEQATRQTGLS